MTTTFISLLTAVALLLAISGCAPAAAAPDHGAETPTWTVHFSPRGGCASAIVELIGSAKRSVHLAAYSFTSQPIADALVAAARAGRQVQLVLDRSDRATPTTARVAAGGVDVWIDAQHPIMHDKYVIIDGTAVETGSYNFTNQAEARNAENCLIVRDRALAAEYLADWQRHQQHSAASPR